MADPLTEEAWIAELHQALLKAKQRASDGQYPGAYGYLERAVEHFLQRQGIDEGEPSDNL